MSSNEVGNAADTTRTTAEVPLAELITGTVSGLKVAASDPRLTEDLALKLLERRDLPPEAIEAIAGNTAVMKHRRVIVAVVSHLKTPRFISLPMARRLFTFELTKIALLPSIAADLKVTLEEAIVARLGTTSSGERLSIAKQGSSRVAAALLLDQEPRVMRAALENPRMTEGSIVRALMSDKAQAGLVQAVSGHPRWSQRKEVQIALLRNEHTPLARALQLARSVPTSTLREVLENSRLSPRIKSYLRAEFEKRNASS